MFLGFFFFFSLVLGDGRLSRRLCLGIHIATTVSGDRCWLGCVQQLGHKGLQFSYASLQYGHRVTVSKDIARYSSQRGCDGQAEN